ncbi:hypothetical protein EG835_12795, partial [bacterium]|nr:hypothetical protein [bacterium]
MIRRFVLSSAFVVLGMASGCGGEAPSTSGFATRAEAGRAVPTWVPASANDLKVQSDERSGAFWLRFRLPAADRGAVEAELLRIPDEQVATLTFRAPKGADWWFRGLVQVVPARETTVVAADVY